MAKLTAKGRKQVKTFAVPKGKGSNPDRNQYPIHDASHARNALARVQQNGTPAEKAMVKRAVKKKYPGIAVGTSPGSSPGSAKKGKK